MLVISSSESVELSALPLPPWLCQPYVRIPPDVHVRRCEEGQQKAREQRLQDLRRRLTGGDDVVGATLKRQHFEQDGEQKEADLLLQSVEFFHLSKKKAKKLLRNPRKKFPGPAVENLNLCICRSPRVSIYCCR